MSPHARYLRDRANFLSRWADRLILERPAFTALPTCETCGEEVPPSQWDAHHDEHRREADTYTREAPQ